MTLDSPTVGSQDRSVPYERGTHLFFSWPFYRTSSGVHLCWKLEEPTRHKGPVVPLGTLLLQSKVLPFLASPTERNPGITDYSPHRLDSVEHDRDAPNVTVRRDVEGYLAHKKAPIPLGPA